MINKITFCYNKYLCISNEIFLNKDIYAKKPLIYYLKIQNTYLYIFYSIVNHFHLNKYQRFKMD